MTIKATKPPKVRIQQAWEMIPRATDYLIPAAPAGIVRKAVLPTQTWAHNPCDDELASYTVTL